MENVSKSLILHTLNRWGNYLLFALAISTLLFLIWCASVSIQYPYDGITDITSNGFIKEIAPSGPAYGLLSVGDEIKSVDGVPVLKAIPFYAKKHAGDSVDFIVLRNNEILPITLNLISPTRGEIYNRLLPIFVAFIFCLTGLSVLAFKPQDSAATVFYFFNLTSAGFLSAGVISFTGPQWTSSLFSILEWMIGPLAVHFHLMFPQQSKFRYKKVLIFLLYGCGVAGGLPFLLVKQTILRAKPWFPELLTVMALFLALNLLITVGLLFYSYRYSATPGTRGKIRIVVFGGILSALPPIALTILPDALLGVKFLSYSSLFLFLGVLPLTYSYAIFRHRLIEIDRHVNRGATFVLVYLILVTFYFFLTAIIHRWIKVSDNSAPLVDIIIIIILVRIFIPLRVYTQRLVDRVFYGGWYDFRSAVSQITQGLEQVMELPGLAQEISNRLVKTLRLEDACVFLRSSDGDFSVIAVSPPGSELNNKNKFNFPPLPRTSLTYLLNIGAVERTNLRKSLLSVKLSPEEQQLLNSEQVHLWVPIISHENVQGLLALGPKYGGDIFSAEDMDILRVVVRQISTLIDNVNLLTRLREYAAVLEIRVEERTAELHEEKQRVEAVLSSVGEGVIVTDLKGMILTVNTAFESQTGYDANDVIGKPISSLVNFQYQESLAEISKILLDGKVWRGERFIRCKNNNDLDIHLTIAPIRDRSDQTIGYVASQRDITEYKKIEHLKDQFVLEVSHQLRTPLTNMGLFIELLERGKADKRESYLATLKSEVGQLTQMIEDILDLSRLEIGKYRKKNFISVELNFVTEQVIASYRSLAETDGLNLIFEPSAELPQILGEQRQLARIVDNLLSNAINYTSSGYVRVFTCAKDGWVNLVVEDSGYGIDNEDKPHLFDRFYRGQNSIRSKQMGSGLGLSIVKEIVHIHDGQIEFSSEIGKGSTFTVRFPAIKFPVEKIDDSTIWSPTDRIAGQLQK